MTVQNKTTLKSYFETGDLPTQAQFADLIDSLVVHSDASQLQTQLDVIAEKTANAGVTVDGVLIKDGGLTLTNDVNTTANFITTQTVQAQYIIGTSDVTANANVYCGSTKIESANGLTTNKIVNSGNFERGGVNDSTVAIYKEIGNWDMQGTASVNITAPTIPAGFSIIGIDATIIGDDGIKTTGKSADLNISYIGNTANVALVREAGGEFDDAYYNDGTVQRGYVIFHMAVSGQAQWS